MDIKRPILYLLIFVLIGAGTFYYQYRFYRTPVADSDFLSVEEQFVSTGIGQGTIPSIDDPHFESIGTADQYLDDRGEGIMVEVNGQVRFYPFQILVWHQLINDTIQGIPLLVSYCPLCGSGQVYTRTLGESIMQFFGSGLLFNSNMVMMDRQTETKWSQLTGEALIGDLQGSLLDIYPSTIITWDTFKSLYATGQVLSRQTGFERDYTYNPYANYENSNAVYYPVSHDDARFSSKTVVFGMVYDSSSMVYSREELTEKIVIQDVFGGLPVLFYWDSVQSTARGFERMLPDGTWLDFRIQDNQFVDVQTGSVWNREGKADSGPLRGAQLKLVALKRAYWFCWNAQLPQFT